MREPNLPVEPARIIGNWENEESHFAGTLLLRTPEPQSR